MLCILFLLLLHPINGVCSDFHSPRTDGLGGAGHASPLLSDAIYLNPSFTSFIEAHSFSFNYLTFSGDGTAFIPGSYSGHDLNVSVLDGSADSVFQAGVGLTRRDDSIMIHVGASKSFLTRFGAGIGSKFIFPNNPTGPRIIDGTLSLSGLFLDWFQAAVIVDNLFQTSPERNFDREFVLGTKFNFSPFFMIYLDPHYVPSLSSGQKKLGYEIGLEVPFFKEFFFRIGKYMSSTVPYQAGRGDGYGLGAGWVAPRMSLDYSFSRNLHPINGFSHNFGASIYF